MAILQGGSIVIVYNVDRAWFTLKADAERHRVKLKLPPKATALVRVDNREELAALLNALCGAEEWLRAGPSVKLTAGPEVIARASVAKVLAPDFVPRFLIERDGA